MPFYLWSPMDGLSKNVEKLHLHPIVHHSSQVSMKWSQKSNVEYYNHVVFLEIKKTISDSILIIINHDKDKIEIKVMQKMYWIQFSIKCNLLNRPLNPLDSHLNHKTSYELLKFTQQSQIKVITNHKICQYSLQSPI